MVSKNRWEDDADLDIRLLEEIVSSKDEGPDIQKFTPVSNLAACSSSKSDEEPNWPELWRALESPEKPPI